MAASTQYLEAAKVDELTRELEAEGYQVFKDLQDGNVRYDLVATRAGRKVAIEVKARGTLRNAAPQLRQMREQARQHGYDEFRLVVVSPPRERIIEVDGLQAILLEYLAEHNHPQLEALSFNTDIVRLSVLEINAITVTADTIHVTGTGIIDVTLAYGIDEPHGGMSLDLDFPLTFDILLDHTLRISEARDIEIDTSSVHD